MASPASSSSSQIKAAELLASAAADGTATTRAISHSHTPAVGSAFALFQPPGAGQQVVPRLSGSEVGEPYWPTNASCVLSICSMAVMGAVGLPACVGTDPVMQGGPIKTHIPAVFLSFFFVNVIHTNCPLTAEGQYHTLLSGVCQLREMSCAIESCGR